MKASRKKKKTSRFSRALFSRVGSFKSQQDYVTSVFLDFVSWYLQPGNGRALSLNSNPNSSRQPLRLQKQDNERRFVTLPDLIIFFCTCEEEITNKVPAVAVISHLEPAQDQSILSRDKEENAEATKENRN